MHMQGLEAFNKQHGEVLKSVGVSYEDLLAKGRILALLSLASQSDVLTFAAIRVSWHSHATWRFCSL